MTVNQQQLLTVISAHLKASPVKSALLGGLTLLLLILIGRQLFGGPGEAAAKELATVAVTPAATPTEVESAEKTLMIYPTPSLPHQLIRDPFRANLGLFEPAPGTTGTGFDDEAGDAVDRAVTEMTLQSTVTGPIPMASIDNTIVRTGNVYRGFQIMQIGARFVVIAYGDRQFILTMDQTSPTPPTPDQDQPSG